MRKIKNDPKKKNEKLIFFFFLNQTDTQKQEIIQ